MDCPVPRQRVQRSDLISTLLRETAAMNPRVEAAARAQHDANIAKSKVDVLAVARGESRIRSDGMINNNYDDSFSSMKAHNNNTGITNTTASGSLMHQWQREISSANSNSKSPFARRAQSPLQPQQQFVVRAPQPLFKPQHISHSDDNDNKNINHNPKDDSNSNSTVGAAVDPSSVPSPNSSKRRYSHLLPTVRQQQYIEKKLREERQRAEEEKEQQQQQYSSSCAPPSMIDPTKDPDAEGGRGERTPQRRQPLNNYQPEAGVGGRGGFSQGQGGGGGGGAFGMDTEQLLPGDTAEQGIVGDHQYQHQHDDAPSPTATATPNRHHHLRRSTSFPNDPFVVGNHINTNNDDAHNRSDASSCGGGGLPPMASSTSATSRPPLRQQRPQSSASSVTFTDSNFGTPTTGSLLKKKRDGGSGNGSNFASMRQPNMDEEFPPRQSATTTIKVEDAASPSVAPSSRPPTSATTYNQSSFAPSASISRTGTGHNKNHPHYSPSYRVGSSHGGGERGNSIVTFQHDQHHHNGNNETSSDGHHHHPHPQQYANHSTNIAIRTLSRQANETAIALGLDGNDTHHNIASILPFRNPAPNLPAHLEQKLPLNGPVFVSNLVKKVYACKRMSSPHKTTNVAKHVTRDQLVENGIINLRGAKLINPLQIYQQQQRQKEEEKQKGVFLLENGGGNGHQNNSPGCTTALVVSNTAGGGSGSAERSSSQSPPQNTSSAGVSPFLAHHQRTKRSSSSSASTPATGALRNTVGGGDLVIGEDGLLTVMDLSTISGVVGGHHHGGSGGDGDYDDDEGDDEPLALGDEAEEAQHQKLLQSRPAPAPVVFHSNIHPSTASLTHRSRAFRPRDLNRSSAMVLQQAREMGDAVDDEDDGDANAGEKKNNRHRHRRPTDGSMNGFGGDFSLASLSQQQQIQSSIGYKVHNNKRSSSTMALVTNSHQMLMSATLGHAATRGGIASSPSPLSLAGGGVGGRRAYTPLPMTTQPIIEQMLDVQNRPMTRLLAVKEATETNWNSNPHNKNTIKTTLLDGTVILSPALVNEKRLVDTIQPKWKASNNNGMGGTSPSPSPSRKYSSSADPSTPAAAKAQQANGTSTAQDGSANEVDGSTKKKSPLKPFEVAHFDRRFDDECDKINTNIQQALNERSAASGKLDAAVFVVTRLMRPLYGRDGRRNKKELNGKTFILSYRLHLRALLRWAIGRTIVALRDQGAQAIRAAKTHLGLLRVAKKKRDEKLHYQARVRGATQLLEEVVDVMKNTKQQLRAREALLTEDFYCKLRKRFEYICGTQRMVLSLFELQEMATNSGTEFDVKLFRKIDLDRGGYLEFDEIVHSLFPTVPLKQLRNTMRRFDDENGMASTWRKKIVAESAKAALMASALKKQALLAAQEEEIAALQLTPESKEQVSLLFHATDRDSKGFITHDDMVRHFILPTENPNIDPSQLPPPPKGPFWFDDKFPDKASSVIGLDVFTEMVKFMFPPFKHAYTAPTRWVYKPPPESLLPKEIADLQKRLITKPGYVL